MVLLLFWLATDGWNRENCTIINIFQQNKKQRPSRFTTTIGIWRKQKWCNRSLNRNFINIRNINTETDTWISTEKKRCLLGVSFSFFFIFFFYESALKLLRTLKNRRLLLVVVQFCHWRLFEFDAGFCLLLRLLNLYETLGRIYTKTSFADKPVIDDSLTLLYKMECILKQWLHCETLASL